MICAIEGCGHITAGKSRYCRAHRAVARERFKAMLSAKADERDAKNDRYAELWDRAKKAGLDAGNAITPTPMVVGEPKVIGWDGNGIPPVDHSKKTYYISEGCCGFAWVNVKDRSFGYWLKKHDLGRTDSYYGGVCIWISEHGQSYERKKAHAKALSKVLEEGGIKCYTGSRLD